MSGYYLALAVLSAGLAVLVLALARRTWRRHTPENSDTEHGLVVTTGLAIMATALTATALGQGLGWPWLLAGGSAVIRATFLTTILYLWFRKP